MKILSNILLIFVILLLIYFLTDWILKSSPNPQIAMITNIVACLMFITIRLSIKTKK